MFTSSLPAIGSVVAFSVHKVETRDFPLLSAICSSVSPRIDSIRAIRSSGLPPSRGIIPFHHHNVSLGGNNPSGDIFGIDFLCCLFAVQEENPTAF